MGPPLRQPQVQGGRSRPGSGVPFGDGRRAVHRSGWHHVRRRTGDDRVIPVPDGRRPGGAARRARPGAGRLAIVPDPSAGGQAESRIRFRATVSEHAAVGDARGSRLRSWRAVHARRRRAGGRRPGSGRASSRRARGPPRRGGRVRRRGQREEAPGAIRVRSSRSPRAGRERLWPRPALRIRRLRSPGPEDGPPRVFVPVHVRQRGPLRAHPWRRQPRRVSIGVSARRGADHRHARRRRADKIFL